MGLTIIVAVLVLPRGIAGLIIAPPWQRKPQAASKTLSEREKAAVALSAQPVTPRKEN